MTKNEKTERPNIMASFYEAKVESEHVHDLVDWMYDAVVAWRNDPKIRDRHPTVDYGDVDTRDDQVITIDMVIKLIFECEQYFETKDKAAA